MSSEELCEECTAIESGEDVFVTRDSDGKIVTWATFGGFVPESMERITAEQFAVELKRR